MLGRLNAVDNAATICFALALALDVVCNTCQAIRHRARGCNTCAVASYVMALHV